MQRLKTAVVLTLALAGCSAKAPAQNDSPRPPPTELLASTSPGTNAPNAPSPNATVAVPAPDPREAALSKVVLELFEEDHLLRKKVDDDISRTAFATYIDRLDGGKMFLLKADRDALNRYVDKIDDELRSGSLDLAHDGAKIFAARVGVVDKLVTELLASPLNHTDEEWVELDPKKVQVAETEQQLRDRWRQRLELEVLERVAQMEARLDAEAEKAKAKAKGKKPTGSGSDADSKDDEEKSTVPLAQIPATHELREAKARADLAKSYAARFARLRTPAPLDAAADLVNAVASTLDPHTTYLPPAEKANFDIHMSGSLEGIGAVLRERDHYIEILELVPGGASWRQGSLTAGDLILSVAQVGKDPIDVADMRIDEVVSMIRGPKGTVVQLRVQKAAGTEQTIAITRDVVVVEEAYARGAVLTRKGQPAFGYIHLPSFYGGKGAQHTSAADMHRLFAEMKQRKVAGIVLDIRSNGGGLLGDAVKMTGDLIDQGPVVQVKDSRGRKETLADREPGTEYDGPVIVLVDRFSASASEILAAALQDYKRAIIVGTGPTHGKGTVQTLADLDQATNGKIVIGSLKITIQQFFRVDGPSTQREGVTPDIMLPDPAAHIESGERELEHAIAASKIDPVKHDIWPAKWNPSGLAQKSAARVAKQPMLMKIAAATALLKARMKDTRVPLAEKTWLTRRKEQKAALEAASPDLKKQPAAFGVAVVEDPNATVTPPPGGGKKDDRLAKWSDNLAHDPWVDECLSILGDMK